MTKKSIAALTVLALTSLFSLTQVTSASAAEQGALEVHSMDKTIQLRQEIKDAKDQFYQLIVKRTGGDKAQAEVLRDDLEKHIPFMVSSFRTRHYDWYQKNEFPTRDLEDKLTAENDLTDLLNQYQSILQRLTTTQA
ncbi:hypothetical protein [Streptococcus halichoeri]|uniref:hypothetical protein n=1 Tax=Streptococcus halichoeri TaxID=254785 RepID=UPI00135AD49F|nr:hypothetical protein [Streptococcus halichoeri]